MTAPGSLRSAFGLWGGPVAWYVQFCAGYALATQPCFPKDQRLTAPAAGAAWTEGMMTALLVFAVLVALSACWVSWRTLAETGAKQSGTPGQQLDRGAERIRFLALWGLIFGAGFAVATVITAVAFLILPRCAG